MRVCILVDSLKVDVLRFVEKTGGTTAKCLAEVMKVSQCASCMALLRATRQGLMIRKKDNYGEYCYTITVLGRERIACA